MLYDVLPPSIFFISLGGIILTTSRVILRIRREQAGQAASSTIKKQVLVSSKNTDFASLVGPTKKSVHVIKNRLALIGHTIQNSTTRIKTEWELKKKTRNELKKQKHSEKINQKKSAVTKLADPAGATSPADIAASKIIQPKTPHLRSTFNSIGPKAKNTLLFSKLKLKKVGTIVAKASSMLKEKLPKKNTETEITQENKAFPTEKPKLRLVEVDNNNPAAPDNSTSVTTENNGTQSKTELPVTQKGLSRIFNKKEAKKTPLDKAQQELAAANYQNVENILVPYLMKNPRNTSAYMLLGKAALGRHAWDEATEIFEQAVAINPTTKRGYASLGYAAYRTGKLTKALEALQKAHNAEPNNVVIIKRLLTIAQRMDNQPMQKSLEEKLTDLQVNQE